MNNKTFIAMEKERRYEVLTLSRLGRTLSCVRNTKDGALAHYKGLVDMLRGFDEHIKGTSETAYVIYREVRVLDSGNELVVEERSSYVL